MFRLPAFMHSLRGWLPSRRSRDRPRLIALLAFHDERRYLDGYLRNVSAQVDGIVALDDGSTDGSSEIVAGHPAVLELIRRPARSNHVWDEPANKAALFDAASRHTPDWLIAVDADERLELGFRRRAASEIDRAASAGIGALSLRLRELWDSPRTFRIDGVWGEKRVARLFRHRGDAEVDPRPMHGSWAPLNSRTGGGFPPADLELYHLRMIDPAARRARRAKYERLDPSGEFQKIGYAYLTDETGIRLSPLPKGREYEPEGVH